MVCIRFPDEASKHRTLGYLAGRFPWTSFVTGEVIVPPEALAALDLQGIPYRVERPTPNDDHPPQVRVPSAVEVQ